MSGEGLRQETGRFKMSESLSCDAFSESVLLYIAHVTTCAGFAPAVPGNL